MGKIKFNQIEDIFANHGITVDAGASVISTGLKGYFRVPYACTIKEWAIVSEQTGSIVFDIWKKSEDVPTVTDTITASAKPTLTSAQLASSGTLTGWTTSISAGDVLGYNVDSVSSCQKVTLILKVQKT